MPNDKCTTCGIEMTMPGRCRNCYEVELRLEEYIQSKKGFDFVLKTVLNQIWGNIMEITIDVPKKSIDQLMSVTDSNNKEEAIKKAIDFTNDRY